ncbi:hypothetical protein IMZ48_17125, partial [Candidatus Bathyarchaeota archaeon]|nr:hypothetical protein [Candidatus Bathyarchaeota archaeon]
MDLINSGVVAHCNIPTDTDDFGPTWAVMKLLEATITTFTGSYADWAYSAGGSFGTESACPWDQSQFADRLGACSHNALLEGVRGADCNICDIAFASPDDLFAHARTSQRHERLTGIPPEERDYFCDICGIGNKTPEWLALHYSSDAHREAAGVRDPYFCDECDVGIRSEALLREHVKSAEHRIAAGFQPLGQQYEYHCKSCGRGYYD